MADDPNGPDRVDRDIRITKLKHEAEGLAGGEMTAWESPDCPPEVAEAFWQGVVDYEKAPLTSPFETLTDAGVELPPPDELTDADLSAKLWVVIHRLARRRTFVSQTNHLSDRELYTYLWSEGLREAAPDLPVSPHAAWFIDLLGSGSDEDNYLYLKYYASEETRRRWSNDFFDGEMPPHEDPPYDRDRHLPRAGF